MPSKTWVRGTVVVVVLLAILMAVGYAFILWEGSSTREAAPAWEKSVAQWLLHQTVPAEDRRAPNPLLQHPDPADVTAGQQLFLQRCELCHAHDGSGVTNLGAGQYPHPPDLRSAAIQSQSDGELRYHIRNGVRHTGMPSWTLPERDLWQLVLYVRDLPKTARVRVGVGERPDVGGSTYVGSRACEKCHQDLYARWKKTLMANIVRDPREHPEAITPDLSKADPLVTFTASDVALVYGSKWKQRYFKRVGDDYFPMPAQWDVTHQLWRPYFVKAGTDWWASLYPPDNMQRPTGPLCDGCHSVNYDIKTKTVTEWNVGCERCHGPGSRHAEHPMAMNIVNPARLDYVQANDVCISCHSQGKPLANPFGGRYYDWPVGYEVGKRLGDFWKLEEFKPGEQTFTHFAEGSAHKNRMQGNDFVQSLMYTRGVTCFSCHDAHGTPNAGLLRAPGNAVCLACHGPATQNGPRAASIEAHSHHKAGSPGNECAACHMPKIAQTIADVNVRVHTFRFITPAQTAALKIPNACDACHEDKPAGWSAATLRNWSERSPWRMGQ
jgi:predicted CXXCH cytochrome family protein